MNIIYNIVQCRYTFTILKNFGWPKDSQNIQEYLQLSTLLSNLPRCENLCYFYIGMLCLYRVIPENQHLYSLEEQKTYFILFLKIRKYFDTYACLKNNIVHSIIKIIYNSLPQIIDFYRHTKCDLFKKNICVKV